MKGWTMITRSLSMTVAAIVVGLAVITASVPAFAWLAPDNYGDYLSQPTQAQNSNQPTQAHTGIYNYAPASLAKQTPHAAHNRKDEAR
jgi:hypothetical protein